MTSPLLDCTGYFMVFTLLPSLLLASPIPGTDYGGNNYGANGIGAGGAAPYGGYDIGYEVDAPKYGNYHNRRETSDNDGVVTGSYSVAEADGSLRTVDYVADWVNGFRATVRDKFGVRHHGYVKDDHSKGKY